MSLTTSIILPCNILNPARRRTETLAKLTGTNANSLVTKKKSARNGCWRLWQSANRIRSRDIH